MNRPKFITTLVVLISVLLFLPVFAAASPGITESEVMLKVDYGKFTKDNQDTITVTTETITITNDGLSQITVTVEATGLTSQYKGESKQVIVPANGSATTFLTIEVPHKKEPGKEKIGTIVIYNAEDANKAQLDSADLVQETASMLELKELEVRYINYRGDAQKEEFKSAEKKYDLNDEVKPYTEVSLTFNLKNVFDSGYKNDGRLDEVELTIDADDDDLFEKSPEEVYVLDTIEAGKDTEYTVSFLINKEIEPETYTLELTITAEDGQGIEYTLEKELVLEVELDDDDVRIVKAEVKPVKVTTCDAEFFLDLELHNFGTDSQQNVGLSIVNDELGLNENVPDIAIKPHLKEGQNTWKKVFSFGLPQNVKAKTYFLDLTAYINKDYPADNERVEVEIGADCVLAEEPVEATSEQEAEVAAGGENSAPQETSTETANVVKTVEGPSYTTNDYVMALLVIAIVAVAVMIVLLLVALFRK